MSPHSPAVGLARSAAAVNEAIRAIGFRAQGRKWTRAETALYQLLVEEWLAAEDDVAEAA